MHSLTRVTTIAALAAATLTPLTARAADVDGANAVETIEVKRADVKEPKHPTLQFLKDNRMFIRAQIDRLRLQVKREETGEAEMLDPRYLRLKEMSASIAAARDTVHAEGIRLSERALLANVTDLGDLVAELNMLDRLLDDQRHRLLRVEDDFLAHQETALVILVRGLTGKRVPDAIVVSEDDTSIRVELTPEQRASLAQGGIAQIYHEFVEPRTHTFDVAFEGTEWAAAPPVPVSIETARDRLTFLELDLSRLDSEREAAGLLTRVWSR